MEKTIIGYKNKIIALILIVLTGVGASASSPWTVNPSDYRYDMSLYLEVRFGEDQMDYSLYDVGVFFGEECRGVAEILPLGNGKNCLYMRARSNKASGETMTFKYYDRSTKEISSIEGASFVFESNGRLGYPSDPYIVRIVTYYDVTVSAGSNGSVDCDNGRIAEGTKLILTAVPDEGYKFLEWSDGSTENPRDITVDGDINLTAKFEICSYKLTIYLNGEIYSSEDVYYSTELSIKDPDVPEGTKFEGWSTEIPATMPAHDLDIYGTYLGTSAIESVSIDSTAKVTVYSLSGHIMYKNVLWRDIAGYIKPGIYIVNGDKIAVFR